MHGIGNTFGLFMVTKSRNTHLLKKPLRVSVGSLI